MNIIITGSSGFIARNFVDYLLGKGHRVWGIDIKPSRREHPWFMQFNWDITKKEQFALFSLPKIDACFHFAAIADLNYARQHCAKTIDINVNGTANMLEYCKKLGVDVFNYISTCCVYGNTLEHPTSEDAPKNPTDIYGNTKLAGEYLVRTYGLNGLDYNILRLGTVYGPSMRRELAIYIFLEKALKQQPILIHGSGKQTRTFIFIDDLINGLNRVIEANMRNEVINLAGAEEVSVLKLASACANLSSNPQPKETLKFVKDRPGQILKEQIDISKAKKLLGWQPATRMDEGLKLSHEWVKKQL